MAANVTGREHNMEERESLNRLMLLRSLKRSFGSTMFLSLCAFFLVLNVVWIKCVDRVMLDVARAVCLPLVALQLYYAFKFWATYHKLSSECSKRELGAGLKSEPPTPKP